LASIFDRERKNKDKLKRSIVGWCDRNCKIVRSAFLETNNKNSNGA
jgi:hypothetical protein